MAMLRAVLVALVGLALAAPPAFAAAPWSAPQNVSAPAPFIDDPHIVVDTAGRAYATWTANAGSGGSTVSRMAVREPGAASFGPERAAPRFVASPVPYGVERVLGLDQRSRSRGRVSLRARSAGSNGTFGRPDTIATYVPGADPPSLALHDFAVAAWVERTRAGRRVVRSAIRRGSRFGRPVTLRGRGRSRDVVAAAGQGIAFVAWERAGVVEARVRRVGLGWGPVRRIGRAARGATTFRAMFNGRRGYLVWLSEGGERGMLRVAVLPTGGTRFHSPQEIDTIDRAAPVEPHGPEIVPVPERRALLAWTDWDGSAWRVRASATEPGARFGAPLDASPAGEQAVLGAAASIPVGTEFPPGTVIVVWSRLDAPGEVGDRVRAALRPQGGSFGPPEDVSDLDRARLPDLAFDFAGRRWTSVWSQRIGPDQGVPLTQITTFLRSATRPAG